MDELSKSARALIDRAGPCDDPTVEDAHRVHRAVLVRVGAIGLGSAALAAGATAQAKTAAALVTKIGAALVLVVGGAATVAYVTRSPEPQPPSRPALAAPAKPAQAAAPAPNAADTSEPAPLVADTTLEPKSAEGASPRPAAPAEAAAPALSAANLAAEMQLIRAADAALRAGNSGEALARLAQHEREHPKGELTEERQGLRLIARCQAGASGSAADGARFLSKAPKSPLASRLRTACSLAK